jgi:hypothetical protein
MLHVSDEHRHATHHGSIPLKNLDTLVISVHLAAMLMPGLVIIRLPKGGRAFSRNGH